MKKLILILIMLGILSLSSCKKSDSIETNEPFLKELIILKKEHPSLHNDNYTNSTYFLHTLNDRIFSFIRYDQT